MIFRKNDKIDIIFYNGDNKQAVIDFFSETPFGKYLRIIENDLHYEPNEMYGNKSYIKTNRYIYFSYDQWNWWRCIIITKEEFDKNFIEVK
jgi:hypothetical protein